MIVQCKNCGRLFKHPNGSKTFCTPECRKYYQKHKAEEKFAVPAPKKTLDDWVREAKELGMSYGKYRAEVIRTGKSFELLKKEREKQ